MHELNTKLTILSWAGSMATISTESTAAIVAEFRQLIEDTTAFDNLRSEYGLSIPSAEDVSKIIAISDNVSTPIEEAATAASGVAWPATLYVLIAKAIQYGCEDSLRHCVSTHLDVMQHVTQLWQSKCIAVLLSHRQDELESFYKKLHLVQQLISQLGDDLSELAEEDEQLEDDPPAIIIAPSSSAIH